MQVSILRYNPSKDKEPYFQRYDVPYRSSATVLNVLEYIWETLDRSLEFRASCRMQKCGGCSVSVNGKPVLSCKERVTGDNILVEPLPNFKVVKDLIVDRSPYDQRVAESISAASSTDVLMPPRPPDDPQWPDCIECLICDATCPVVAEGSGLFFGPAHLMGIPTLNSLGSKSEVDRLANQYYLCLACQNCDTNCPAGVPVGSLIEKSRGDIERVRRHSPLERVLRQIVLHGVFKHPRQWDITTTLLRFYQRTLQRILHTLKVDRLLPEPLRTMDALLPPIASRFLTTSPQHHSIDGERRGKLAFFPGCFMTNIYSSASNATVRVLAKNGYEVVVPPGEVCCGAPHAALGDFDLTKDLAKQNVDTLFQVDVDAIITNCASCGTMLKEYCELLEEDQDYSMKARSVSSKVRDFSEFVASTLVAPMGEIRRTVTYHDPCHLIHTQGVVGQPRQLLRAIPGLELVELIKSEQCCGSAGIYNLIHCDIAESILARKAQNISDTGAATVVTQNPGCLMQLSYGLQKHGVSAEVIHLAELLDQAYDVLEQ